MKNVSFEEAKRRVFPEWVAFLITHDGNGTHAVMPASWCTFTSFEPPMLAVSVANGRHTASLLETSGEFVLAFAGETHAELVRRTGRSSGAAVDKFERFDIPWTPGSQTGCRLIEGAAACFECRLDGKLSTGDHTIFAGRVVAAHAPEDLVLTLLNFGGDSYRSSPK